MIVNSYSKIDAGKLKGNAFGKATTFILVNVEGTYTTTDTHGNETTDNLQQGQYLFRITKITKGDGNVPATGDVSLIWEQV